VTLSATYNTGNPPALDSLEVYGVNKERWHFKEKLEYARLASDKAAVGLSGGLVMPMFTCSFVWAWPGLNGRSRHAHSMQTNYSPPRQNASLWPHRYLAVFPGSSSLTILVSPPPPPAAAAVVAPLSTPLTGALAAVLSALRATVTGGLCPPGLLPLPEEAPARPAPDVGTRPEDPNRRQRQFLLETLPILLLDDSLALVGTLIPPREERKGGGPDRHRGNIGGLLTEVRRARNSQRGGRPVSAMYKGKLLCCSRARVHAQAHHAIRRTLNSLHSSSAAYFAQKELVQLAHIAALIERLAVADAPAAGTASPPSSDVPGPAPAILPAQLASLMTRIRKVGGEPEVLFGRARNAEARARCWVRLAATAAPGIAGQRE